MNPYIQLAGLTAVLNVKDKYLSNSPNILLLGWSAIKKNPKSVGGAIGGAIGVADKLINKGVSNTAGNVLNAVGDVAMMIPGWGTVAGLALKGAGTIVNGLTNTVNEELVRAKGAEIANLAGMDISANNYNDLQAQQDKLNSQSIDLGSLDDWGSAGFLSSGSKRKEARENARKALTAAVDTVQHNIGILANNINSNNFDNMYRSITAFGGPLNIFEQGGMMEGEPMPALIDADPLAYLQQEPQRPLEVPEEEPALEFEETKEDNYEEGKVYEMSEEEYQDLLNKGYELEIVLE